jgi:Rubrerythrin
MNIKESQTWQNMEAALNQEALAYVEYTYYGQQAAKDGYTQISEIFNETAANELHHGKLLFKRLHDGGVPPTLENLKAAFASELEEWDGNYPAYAKVARDEGFDEVADLFEGLAAIEKSHGERFQVLMDRINNGAGFRRKEVQVWYCTVCGHLHIGTEAPEVCPVCAHPQGHFEIRATNY